MIDAPEIRFELERTATQLKLARIDFRHIPGGWPTVQALLLEAAKQCMVQVLHEHAGQTRIALATTLPGGNGHG